MMTTASIDIVFFDKTNADLWSFWSSWCSINSGLAYILDTC